MQGFRTSAAMALTSFFLVARRWDIIQGQWPGYTMPDGDYSGGGVSVGDIYMRRIHTWWRHQRETCSALPALCAGNSPVTGEFPSQRLVMRSFGVFFYLRLNNRGLSKQSWGWWFETHRAHYDVTVMYPQNWIEEGNDCTNKDYGKCQKLRMAWLLYWCNKQYNIRITCARLISFIYVYMYI